MARSYVNPEPSHHLFEQLTIVIAPSRHRDCLAARVRSFCNSPSLIAPTISLRHPDTNCQAVSSRHTAVTKLITRHKYLYSNELAIAASDELAARGFNFCQPGCPFTTAHLCNALVSQFYLSQLPQASPRRADGRRLALRRGALACLPATGAHVRATWTDTQVHRITRPCTNRPSLSRACCGRPRRRRRLSRPQPSTDWRHGLPVLRGQRLTCANCGSRTGRRCCR